MKTIILFLLFAVVTPTNFWTDDDEGYDANDIKEALVEAIVEGEVNDIRDYCLNKEFMMELLYPDLDDDDLTNSQKQELNDYTLSQDRVVDKILKIRQEHSNIEYIGHKVSKNNNVAICVKSNSSYFYFKAYTDGNSRTKYRISRVGEILEQNKSDYYK